MKPIHFLSASSIQPLRPLFICLQHRRKGITRLFQFLWIRQTQKSLWTRLIQQWWGEVRGMYRWPGPRSCCASSAMLRSSLSLDSSSTRILCTWTNRPTCAHCAGRVLPARTTLWAMSTCTTTSKHTSVHSAPGSFHTSAVSGATWKSINHDDWSDSGCNSYVWCSWGTATWVSHWESPTGTRNYT